jgi:cytidylate kinase
MEKIIINVGREVGSSGSEVAKLLAREFNARLLDKELLDLAAQESGFSAKLFKQNDEHRGFLNHLFHLSGTATSGDFYEDRLSPEALFKFQSDAIMKAADEGSCVFVGRCADYVLRERKDVVNVFVSASMDFRIQQIMAKRKIDHPAARKFIEQHETTRASFYNYYTGKKWGAAESYDLCIDASILGLQTTEKLIVDFIRKRFGL